MSFPSVVRVDIEHESSPNRTAVRFTHDDGSFIVVRARNGSVRVEADRQVSTHHYASNVFNVVPVDY